MRALFVKSVILYTNKTENRQTKWKTHHKSVEFNLCWDDFRSQTYRIAYIELKLVKHNGLWSEISDFTICLFKRWLHLNVNSQFHRHQSFICSPSCLIKNQCFNLWINIIWNIKLQDSIIQMIFDTVHVDKPNFIICVRWHRVCRCNIG